MSEKDNKCPNPGIEGSLESGSTGSGEPRKGDQAEQQTLEDIDGGQGRLLPIDGTWQQRDAESALEDGRGDRRQAPDQCSPLQVLMHRSKTEHRRKRKTESDPFGAEAISADRRLTWPTASQRLPIIRAVKIWLQVEG